MMTKKGWLRRQAEMAEAIDQTMADVLCRACGQILEGQSALRIHTDSGCEHPEAYGQLVRLPDGRYGQRHKHPEIR
jgi:hypothetical protein